MAAIGIGITDRDPVFGWESVQSRKRTPAEVRYIEARETADEMWREHNKNVDLWIERGDYAAILDSGLKCQEADQLAHRLYVQWHCPHIHQEYGGAGTHIECGEPVDSVVLYCVDCGQIMDDLVDLSLPSEEIPF